MINDPDFDWKDCDRVWINANVASHNPLVSLPYGEQIQVALAIKDSQIVAVESMSSFDASTCSGQITDCSGDWIIPGLIDCHTHLVYGGQRSREFEQRQKGINYATIADEGGGILSTVRATRPLSVEQLVSISFSRIKALLNEGVTTVEIKSGYGLNAETEINMLRAAQELEKQLPVRIQRTLLAVHALPPEYSDSDYYIDWVCNELLPQVAEQKLAHAVDCFCESIAFSVKQCERVLCCALDHKFTIKAHVEQLSCSGGAAMAANLGALSVDHVEYLDAGGIAAMQKNQTIACLLPNAWWYLHETQKPPVKALREAGILMAVASDLNPGSSPVASLRLAMMMACVSFDLSPEEALTGTTRHAATALGLGHLVGQIKPGMQADFVRWNIEHPTQIASEFNPRQQVERVFAGVSDYV